MKAKASAAKNNRFIVRPPPYRPSEMTERQSRYIATAIVNDPLESVEPSGTSRRRFPNSVLIWQRGAVDTQAVKSRVSAGSACVDQSDRSYLGRDLFRRCLAGGRSEAALDIIDDDLLEIGGQHRTAERHGLFAVDKNRRCRLLASARQRNADIGVFGFAWTVDDAAHHRD